MDYTIVTVSNRIPTQEYYCFNEWCKSVEGTNPLIIQRFDTNYQGLGDKPKFVYRAIKNNVIKTKYIIFCDSWDLVFATTPEEIIKKYLEFNAEIVISAEKNCFPDTQKKEYDELNATSSYKYLNSGFIVGTTEAFLKVLEAMELDKVPDDYWDGARMVHINDQELYQQIFLKQPVKIALDYNQILCNTLHSVKLEELDFTEERIKNIETGTYPCSFHMNGSAKTDGLRNPILSHLKLL